MITRRAKDDPIGEKIKIKQEVEKAREVYEKTSLKSTDRLQNTIMNSSEREMRRGKSVPNLGHKNSKDSISWKMPASKILGVLPY